MTADRSFRDLAVVLDRVQEDVVGRDREIELILSAVVSGRDLLLEGPPGTSKTTLLKAITAAWKIPLIFAEGNAELTPARLLGNHDPARVLSEGYSEETFEPGPLVRAMRSGGFLYIEEFNRAPEDTLNTLLTAIADRRLTVPRLDTVEARASFRLIGSMNPFDNVGTTRLSVSIKDRLNRLAIDYQDAESERAIVARRCAGGLAGEGADRIVDDAVALTRATREHVAVTQGSSVRGAIDFALIAAQLCAMRKVDPDRGGDDYGAVCWDAMLLALSGRVSLDPAAETDEDRVLREIWDERFGEGRFPRRADPSTAGPGAAEVPAEGEADRGRRPHRVRPKELTERPKLIADRAGGGLAAAGGVAAGRSSGRRPGATTFTQEEGGLDEGEADPAAADPAAHRRAREIARRLVLADPLRRRRPPRGGSESRSLPFSGAADEIDLDRTLDALGERRPLLPADIVVRERRQSRRQVILAVDVSGSMRGERRLTAAATVGALAAGIGRDELSVIAFWSEAALVLRRGERAPLERLVDLVLGLDASGLTNVAFPLECARDELTPGASEQRVILLSDCVHNAGPDPRRKAALLPRLDVLFDVSGERDSALAGELARHGRGTVRPIRVHGDVGPALSEILGEG